MVITLNFTLDAPSPLIYYSSGDWRPVNSQDPELPLYNRSTALTSLGAGNPTAQYSFVGTGIWVFGAKRSNHGLYRAILDGTPVTLNGFADPSLHQYVLFSATDLTQGPHNFQIVNTGHADGTNAFLDIDYLLWESQVSDKTAVRMIDNTDLSFTYLPASTSWGNSEDATTSFNTTLTTTTNASGQARLDFVGETVALFGTLGPNHGNYTCSIDGRKAIMYSGTYPSFTTQQVLCFGGSLGRGNHTLVVSNVPIGTSRDTLSIDYAQIWSSQRIKASASDDPPADPPRMTKSGVIIGAVIATCVAVAVGLLVWYLFWFRRRRWRRRKRARSSILTQGPAQAEPEDGTHITEPADLPHLTPFVVNPESSRQTPSRSLDLTAHRGTSSSSHESSDSKGSMRSGSTSSEQTRRSLKSSEPPASSDSHLPTSPRPIRAETRRPLRLHVASLPTSNMGAKAVLGASRRPVKLLPITPARPLRGGSVGHPHVIQEEDGGELNQTTTMAYRVPPAYSQIPPRHSTL